MAINPLTGKPINYQTGPTFGGAVTAAKPAAPAGPTYAQTQAQKIFGITPQAPAPAVPATPLLGTGSPRETGGGGVTPAAPTFGAPGTWGAAATTALTGKPAAGTPAGTTPQSPVKPAGQQPAPTQQQPQGWGTSANFNDRNVTGNPDWNTWQTTAPLYSNTDYINPQTGRDWGKSPRLNMAIAQITGYTGNFSGNTFDTFYNSLDAATKARVDALRQSYPAAPAPTTPAPTTPAPTTPAPTTPAPTTPAGTTPGFEQTGAPTAGAATPAGVSMVMPTFDQAGQFTGYSQAAGNWGNAANMASYYPTAPAGR